MFDKRLDRMERQLTALLLGMQAIIHKLSTRESDVSKLHDDLKALANDVDAAAGRVISAKTESESALADVISQFQATRDKLNAAADDDRAADSGSATQGLAVAGTASDEVARFASTRTDDTGGSS